MIEQEWTKEMKKGTIQLCLLAILSNESKYGFQIIKELKVLTHGYFDLKEGTLYPALHRLEQKGYLISEWRTDTTVPRKYYKITPLGREVLKYAIAEWNLMVVSSKNVLKEVKE